MREAQTPDELAWLETPIALVDLSRARSNLDRVSAYARKHRIGLRPHTKTHKDITIGRLQVSYGALGLTVATSREAEVMSQAADDLLVAYPTVSPLRTRRCLAVRKETRLTFAIDSPEALSILQDSAQAARRDVQVLVEVDMGGGRTGVGSSAEAILLARMANSHFSQFAGLLFHPGHLGGPVDPDQEQGILEVRRALQSYLLDFERAGLNCQIVSGGNSPTLFQSHLIPEMTEIRPGTYVYGDRDLVSRGVMTWQDCAYSILSTVVSTSVPGQVVIDAGTKALAREPLASVEGFGCVLGDESCPVIRMSEEHGILDTKRSERPWCVGDRVRIIPNHVCVSVHLQDEIAYLDGASVEIRAVAARGRR